MECHGKGGKNARHEEVGELRTNWRVIECVIRTHTISKCRHASLQVINVH